MAVVGFEGAYEVSDLGRVRSLRFTPPRVIWQGTTHDGYRYVRLWRDRKLYTFKVHRLVAEAFHADKRNALHNEVAHLDGDRANAKASNLKWVSKVENRSHRKLHGTECGGEKHPTSKLTDAQAAEIRSRRGSATHRALAKEYGVSVWCVQDVLYGRTYKPKAVSGVGRAA